MMEKTSRWDDFLVAEHELIERAMAILKEGLDNLPAAIDKPKKMRRAIDFLLEFGDKMHNRKEEEFLFPLLGRKGVPVQGGPIGVMLMEHEAERELLARMLVELPGLAEVPDSSREKFRNGGYEYLKIRAEHIWKENDVLYAMGRQVFGEEDNRYLLENFYRIDAETYGENARQKFQRMVEEAEQGTAKRKLIEDLSYEQLDGIMEAMPFEVTFVDANDVVSYFNRLDKTKIFPRTRSVIGRKVEKCHPEKSVDTVRKIVEGFRDGSREKAEFWIDFRDDTILIRYFPVFNDAGDYLGVLEVTQEIGAIKKLTGQKRLLD